MKPILASFAILLVLLLLLSRHPVPEPSEAPITVQLDTTLAGRRAAYQEHLRVLEAVLRGDCIHENRASLKRDSLLSECIRLGIIR